MNNEMIEKILDNYARTMSNCKFYEERGMIQCLLNEIGVLRGISYCVEAVGICPHNEDLFHFIKIQNNLLQYEKDRETTRIR